jgi:arylsulfatase A-like enzyme
MVNYSPKKPPRLDHEKTFKKPGRPCSSLHNSCVTLGDSFKAAGYRCGIVGPWHMGQDHIPQHGFEEFWSTYRYQGEHTPDRFFEFLKREGVENLYDRRTNRITPGIRKMSHGILDDPRQQRTTWTMDRGLDFIDGSTEDNRPFFLFLSVKDPHPIIIVPKELRDLYPPSEVALPANWRDPLEGKPRSQMTDIGRIPADTQESDLRELISHYLALITHIDTEVARVMERLKALELTENTIVAFISDHGEMLGEHGFVGKRLLYEPSVRVPFIFQWPAGITPGQKIHAPLGGVDLAPTLLELAGVEPPPGTHGRSFAPDLREGRPPNEQPVFAEICTFDAAIGKTDELEQMGGHIMVRDGDWKLVWNRFDLDELYHLAADPGEMVNLIEEPTCSDRREHLKKLAREMLGETEPAGLYGWFLEN